MLLLAMLLQAGDPSARAEAWIREQMAAKKIPAISVAVVQDGKFLFQRAYGLANVELNVPATPETKFIIASTTKAWAATAIMMQVQAGKIRVDQPVGEVLPELPPSWRSVPIYRLMSHTSGLPDVMLSPNTGEMISHDRDSAVLLAGKLPLQFEVGTDASYNQTNYLLLGMIIDRVTGTPFMPWILENIAKPLGLASPIFGDTRAVVPGRATQYTRWALSADGPPKALDSLRAAQYQYDWFMHMAAGLNTSAGDLARFGDAVRAGRVIRPGLRDTMWTATRLTNGKPFPFIGSAGMGLGWQVSLDSTEKWVGMEGGAAAALHVFPGRKLSVAVLTNLQGAGPGELVQGVAAFFR